MASVTASTTPQTHQGPEPDSSLSDAVPVSQSGEAVAASGEANADAIPAPQPRGSLARRMGLIAAGWIFVLLLGGGIALDRTLSNQ
ncbi:MAG: histidine kinase, partial [Pseudomonadota bacterium]